MAIKTGRYGQVYYDADAEGVGTETLIASLNKWAASFKTDHIEVTCFGDENKVYVPGMKDVSGSFGGFWNSEDTTLFDAADATTPGSLKLVPNSTEPTFFWKGLAYMDADIDVGVNEAPAITGTWMAAGPWTREPASTLLLRGVGPGGDALSRDALLADQTTRVRASDATRAPVR